MRSSRRLFLLFTAAVVLVFLALGGAVGLWMLRDAIHDRLSRAGFDKTLDVRLDLSGGVRVDRLSREQPLHVGPLDVALDIDRLDVPLDLWEVVFLGKRTVERVHITGARVVVGLGDTRSKDRGSGAARGPALLRALPELCPEGCTVEVRDLALVLAIPGVRWTPPGPLYGEASLGPSGRLTAALRGEDGLDVSLEIDLRDPLGAFEAHAFRPGRLEMDLERIAWARTAPLRSFTEPLGRLAGAVRSVEVEVEAIHARSGAPLRLAGVRAAVLDLRGRRAEVAADLVSLGSHPRSWCGSAPLCPESAEGLRLSIYRRLDSEPSSQLSAERATTCGPACLRVTGLRARISHPSEQGPRRADLGIDDLSLRWAAAGRWPAWVRADSAVLTLRLPEPPASTKGATPRAAAPEPRVLEPMNLVDPWLRYADAKLERWRETVLARVGLLAERSGAPDPEIRARSLRLELYRGETLQGRAEAAGVGLRGWRDEALTLWGRARLELGTRSETGGSDRSDRALEVAGTLRLGSGGEIDAAGRLRLPPFRMEHRLLAPTPVAVRPLELQGILRRSARGSAFRWLVPDLSFSVPGGAHGTLRFGLEANPLPHDGSAWLSLDLPRQDCGAMFRSIPAAMLPHLNRGSLRGAASAEALATADLTSLRTLKLSINADFSRCVPEDMAGYNPRRLLRQRAVFRVFDPKLGRAVRVGPGTRNWVPLALLPAHVWGSALATEDVGFFEHHGFAPGLIRRALIMNLERRRYAYGGSTITQQLVKNLFLSRDKTLARKIEEAFLVWAVERRVPKDRILELYVNCIEYGPDLYGIRDAARRYYGVEPEDLRAVESAFIMALKPSPEQGYRRWRRRKLSTWWSKRLATVRRRLLEHSWIGVAEAEGMDPERVFERAAPVPQTRGPRWHSGVISGTSAASSSPIRARRTSGTPPRE